MARKPSTRKRREPAPAASTRAEPAASNKRPTTKPGAACLERVLTRDATHFNLVAQLVEWCGCAAPLAALDATSTTCAEAARTPVKLALTTATEAQTLGVFGEVPRVAAEALNGGRGPTPRRDRGPDGAHANIALEATAGGLYRPQAAPPGVRVVATGAADALADCGVLVLDTSKLGPAARARRVVRRLALETTAQQASDGNRLQHELVALAAALDQMGRRTAAALDVPLCQALDLILAVGAAAADVEDGRMTLEAVRRACAAAPRSAAASRQDRASRRSADPRAWFELARRGQARPSPPRATTPSRWRTRACSRRSSRASAPWSCWRGPRAPTRRRGGRSARSAYRSSMPSKRPGRRRAASTWTRWRRSRTVNKPNVAALPHDLHAIDATSTDSLVDLRTGREASRGRGPRPSLRGTRRGVDAALHRHELCGNPGDHVDAMLSP